MVQADFKKVLRNMPFFTFCNQILESNIDLPELLSAHIDSSFFFRLLPTTEQVINPVWLHHWYSNDNSVVASYGRQGADHWLQFPDMADFRISQDAREIYCYPLPEIPRNTIRHLLLDQVLPRCMAYHGQLLLHASAVKTLKGLILFTGATGAGKSTLAGYFHQSGYPAISDDCMLISEEHGFVNAIPSYGGIRLWQDSQEFLFPPSQDTANMAHYSSKKRILFSNQATNDLGDGNSILAIIFLSSPAQNFGVSDPMLNPVSMRDGYMELLKQLYQLDVTNVQKLSLNAQSLGRIIPRIPMFRLTMPRYYESLPVVRQLILDKVLSISVTSKG